MADISHVAGMIAGNALPNPLDAGFRNGRRRGGSVKGGCSVPVHRSAAETLDGFFPPRLDRCMKRERSDGKEIRSSFLIAVRLCAR